MRRLGFFKRIGWLLATILIVANTSAVSALSGDELNSLNNDTLWYAPSLSTSSSSCSGGSTTLSGSDNEQKVWNFFKSQGLSDGQVAGVMGNLEQESSFTAEDVEGGGTSATQPTYILPGTSPPHSPGWGLAQWTLPWQDVVKLMQDNNISGQINDLGAQLNLVLAQMKGTSPVGAKNMISGLPNDPEQAADYFDKNFEGGTDPINPSTGKPVRQGYADDILAKYGGSAASSTGAVSPSTYCGGGGSISPNCQSATGSARILCDAQTYDSVSYSETYNAGHQGGAAWHASCPTVGPSCVLDCSGLVNIAIYDVFNINITYNTFGEVSDSANWKAVPLAQLQPGDLIQPGAMNGNHVEIVDHVVGNTIYTFGAHTSNVPQPQQVGPVSYQASPTDLYLHFIGGGNG